MDHPNQKMKWGIAPGYENGPLRLPVPGGWLYRDHGAMSFVPEAVPSSYAPPLRDQVAIHAMHVAIEAEEFKKFFEDCYGKYPGTPIQCPYIRRLFEAVSVWAAARDRKKPLCRVLEECSEAPIG